MLSKKEIKLINSLKVRKYRKKYGLFLAEGKKIVLDFINSGLIPKTIIIDKKISEFDIYKNSSELIHAQSSEISKISNLKTPADVLAVFEIKNETPEIQKISNNLVLFCDDIQNPGNFGTIIRTANWFGIKNILCTNETVDVYNPKVIQSTMGAISGIHVFYIDPDEIFPDLKKNLTIYGTFLTGKNLYETELSSKGVIVIGNEGNGISKKVKKYIDVKINIPSFAINNKSVESLNASVAAAIVCAEFRRRTL